MKNMGKIVIISKKGRKHRLPPDNFDKIDKLMRRHRIKLVKGAFSYTITIREL